MGATSGGSTAVGMGAAGGWEIPTAWGRFQLVVAPHYFGIGGMGARLTGAVMVGECSARRPATTSLSTQQCCCYYIESIRRCVLRWGGACFMVSCLHSWPIVGREVISIFIWLVICSYPQLRIYCIIVLYSLNISLWPTFENCSELTSQCSVMGTRFSSLHCNRSWQMDV